MDDSSAIDGPIAFGLWKLREQTKRPPAEGCANFSAVQEWRFEACPHLAEHIDLVAEDVYVTHDSPCTATAEEYALPFGRAHLLRVRGFIDGEPAYTSQELFPDLELKAMRL